MKIDSSFVAMQGSSTKQQSVRIATEVRQAKPGELTAEQDQNSPEGVAISISAAAKSMHENVKVIKENDVLGIDLGKAQREFKDIEITMLEQMLQALTGKKIKLFISRAMYTLPSGRSLLYSLNRKL
jgi:hypothetical protein